MNLDYNFPERTAFYRSKVVEIQSDCTNQSISDEQFKIKRIMVVIDMQSKKSEKKFSTIGEHMFFLKAATIKTITLHNQMKRQTCEPVHKKKIKLKK